MYIKRRFAALAAGAVLLSSFLPGCGNSREDFVITNPINVNPGIVIPEVGPQNILALVSNNGDSNRGQVDAFDRLFNLLFTGNSGNNQGLALDSLFNLYHAGDVDAPNTPGSVRIFARLNDRVAANATPSFDAQLDRILGGTGTTNTGLVNPKGHDIAQSAGFIIIADFGAGDLKVFGTAAGGDVTPVATVALSENPWDVAYDEANDRIFIAGTSGNVLVFDDFIGGNFAGGTPDRTITPTVEASNEVRNLHGIVYNAGNDTLVVSDVGAANANQGADFATDGRLYSIANASTADGAVLPVKVVQGPATLLGNPVDIDLNGNDLRVAEKAGDKLLVFPDFFNALGGDFPPTVAVDEVKPESVRTAPALITIPTDASDQDALASFTGIVASSNEGAADNVGGDEIIRLSQNLATQQGNFDIPQDVESVKVDARGDIYATFDAGIAVLNRVASSRDDGDFNTSRDRVISGGNTGLNAPKGLDLVEGLSWIVVADVGADQIAVFGKEANGDVAPIFTTPAQAGGGEGPWDVDYDPGSDTLFVAMTDGTVFVYLNFSTDGPTATGPDFVITPVDGGNAQISDNLHGIVFDSLNGALIVSDVGASTGAGAAENDGSIYVFTTGLNATGNVQPSRVIEGAATNLGNPVDVAYDGTNLYVAEKANNGGRLLRFDNIRTSAGSDPNTAPDVDVAFTNPESVSINTLAPFTP